MLRKSVTNIGSLKGNKMKKCIKYISIVMVIFLLSFSYAHINKMHAVFNEKIDQSLFVSTEISSQEEYRQAFIASEDAIDGIALKFARSGEEIDKVVLKYAIEDASGKVVREGRLDGENFRNQKYNKLKFDRINDAKGKELVFICQVENNDESNGISLYKESGTLVMKYYCFRFDLETFCIAFALCVYVIVFMRILFKIFKE